MQNFTDSRLFHFCFTRTFSSDCPWNFHRLISFNESPIRLEIFISVRLWPEARGLASASVPIFGLCSACFMRQGKICSHITFQFLRDIGKRDRPWSIFIPPLSYSLIFKNSFIAFKKTCSILHFYSVHIVNSYSPSDFFHWWDSFKNAIAVQRNQRAIYLTVYLNLLPLTSVSR